VTGRTLQKVDEANSANQGGYGGGYGSPYTTGECRRQLLLLLLLQRLWLRQI
jgi:hypothetical protein